MSKPVLCESCLNQEQSVVFRAQVWSEELICLYNMSQRGRATACKNYDPKDEDAVA